MGSQGIADIASVESGRWFKEHNVDFLAGNRTVLSTSRYDHEFTLLQLHGFFAARRIFVVHAKVAVYHQEQLVLLVMVMPDEFALKLNQLDVLPVQLAYDFRRPMILKRGELLRQIDLVHHSKVAQKPSLLTGASNRGSSDDRSNAVQPNKRGHRADGHSRSADQRTQPRAGAGARHNNQGSSLRRQPPPALPRTR